MAGKPWGAWKERIRCSRCRKARYLIVRTVREVAEAEQRQCKRCLRKDGPSHRQGVLVTHHGGETIHRLPLPPRPTTALPGTPEKIAIMAARLEAGYHLHHPKDADSEGYWCDVQRRAIRDSRGAA